MFIHPKQYDVIVVGGGHAGVEAALAASRIGCATLMLTHNADTIGQMSCNPAIGGSAKGHLVREVDALGGEMGRAADLTGIQFRILNRSKGPAVWSPRAQCDKKAYQLRLKWVCEQEPNLDVMQQQVSALVIQDQTAIGVDSSLGVRFLGKTVVITTGTFLQGLLHFGDAKQPGGRSGDSPSQGLSASLKQAGLELRRFKTGTPPRVLMKGLDFNRMERQDGDEPPPLFSHWWHTNNGCEDIPDGFHNASAYCDSTRPARPSLCAEFFSPKAGSEVFHVEHSDYAAYPPDSLIQKLGGQVPCYLTSTTPKTREIILGNLHKSAMYSGQIEGVGPRYCPSIEDKFVRFADKQCHQVFIEPEGIATDELYLNGCSSSLPFEVQFEMVRSIVGCEQAEILRPAYAVEYDYCPPTQLYPWLETKSCRNLFLGGQINGTSGYEEAAAQGLMAGINAARRSQAKPEFVLGRDQAYIGVLIDDLVTKGTAEPYRMFTSRVERRLLLRQDNADLRLSKVGNDIGLLCKEFYNSVLDRKNKIHIERQRLEQTKSVGVSLWSLLRQPEVSYSQLPNRHEGLPEVVIRQLEILAKYEGYIAREEQEVCKAAALDQKQIPSSISYQSIQSLRREARENFERLRPTTLGQASRISGITPNDVAVLATWLKRATFEPAGITQSKA